VLGAWLAHDDFQPAGPTPFRASVPPPQPGPAARAARRARRRLGRREPAVPILLYHRIADLPADGLGLAVHRAHFAEHLEILARDWCPLGLDELVERQRTGDLPARAVAITFDDGYVDNLTDAVPALRAAGLAATVFVATGAVPAGGPFFWDEAARLVEAAAPHGTLALELEGQRRAWRLGTPAQRRVATRHLHQWLQSLRPESVAAALAELRDSAVEEPLLDARAVTVDELRRLDEAVVIGAHTRRHPRLAALAPDEQRAEIEGSRDDLAAWLDRRPAGFAYPFGVPGFDFDATTVELVRAAGFRYAVANASGPVTAASDPLALPRVIAPDVAGAEFAGWLERQVVVA
jgi:peptidoglycan/xylan/chitin deacetylase (PgdA/CDA1 family)